MSEMSLSSQSLAQLQQNNQQIKHKTTGHDQNGLVKNMKHAQKKTRIRDKTDRA